MKKLIIILAFASAALGQQQVINGNRVQSGWINYCVANSGSGTTYACTLTGLAGYVSGAVYAFKADVANTGAITLNITSKGAKGVKKQVGSATADLIAGDINVDQVVVVYDAGTYFQMISQVGQSTCALSATFTGSEIANSKTAIAVVQGNCTLTNWTVISDANISATFDIWRITRSSWIGTGSGSSIVGAGTKPSISAAAESYSSTISGWTSVALLDGDTVEVALSGVTVGSATKVVLSMKGTR